MKFIGRKKKKDKYRKIEEILLQTKKGYSVMTKTEAKNAEILFDPFGKTKNDKRDEIYCGVEPHILEINKSVFPWLIRRIIGKNIKLRVHRQKWGEPCTRDLHDGSILNVDKKNKTLIERGVVDEDGFFLDETGNRFVVDGCHVKVDVSDIDFIKSEFHALNQSKTTEKLAVAMSKTGRASEGMWLWIMLMAFGCIVLIVFMLSGGAEGWF